MKKKKIDKPAGRNPMNNEHERRLILRSIWIHTFNTSLLKFEAAELKHIP